MPPDSRRIEEEGALLDSLLLVDGGTLREEATRAALTKGPWPARDVERNLADLHAQIASMARGQIELDALIDRYGTETVLGLCRPCAGQRRGMRAPGDRDIVRRGIFRGHG